MLVPVVLVKFGLTCYFEGLTVTQWDVLRADIVLHSKNVNIQASDKQYLSMM